MKARSSSLFAAALLLMPLGAAQAQDHDAGEQQILERAATLPVSVKVKVGFAGKTPNRGFVPVFVDLTSSERALGVSVVVRAMDGANTLLRLGPVELERGTPRRLTGIAPARLLSESKVLHLTVETKDNAIVGEALAYSDSTFDRLLLILDRRGAPPCDLSQLRTTDPTRKGSTMAEARWLTASVSSVDALPDSMLAYTSVSTVLLGDLELERWSEAQARALAGFIARGGALVISVGKQGSLLRKSLLGRRLGQAAAPIPFDTAAAPGSGVTLARALNSFGSLDGIDSTHPPYLAVLNPGEHDTILQRTDDGRPLVVKRRHGLGQVTFVACDLWAPPFLHAPHTSGLVASLLSSRSHYRPRTQYLFSELSAIRQPAQIGPAFALLIVFALIAGPGVYFFLRAKKRGILLWVVIPGLTVAFTMLVPFYRLALKDGESTIVGVRLVESASGESLAVETIDTLLFSGSLDTKTIGLDGDDAAAFAVIPPRAMRRGRRRGSPDLGSVLGRANSDGRLAFDLRVALWGARYMSFERTQSIKPTTGRVELGVRKDRKRRIRVAINYQGLFPLREPIVVFPTRRGVQIHAIGTDLTSKVAYDQDNPVLSMIGAWEPQDSNLATGVMHRLVQYPLKSRAERLRQAYLIGYTMEPSPIRAEPNVRARSFGTVRVVRLPIHYADGVPFAVATRSTEVSTLAQVNTRTITRRLQTRLALPSGPQHHKRAGRLTLSLSAPRGEILSKENLQLEGLSHSTTPPTWKPIPLLPDRVLRAGSGLTLTVDVPDPRGWISPDGEVRIRQTFDRPRQERDATFSALVDVAVEWGDPAQMKPDRPKSKGSGPKPGDG